MALPTGILGRRKRRFVSRFHKQEWEGLRISLSPVGLRGWPVIRWLPYFRGDEVTLKLVLLGKPRVSVDSYMVSLKLAEGCYDDSQYEKNVSLPPDRRWNHSKLVRFHRLPSSGEYLVLFSIGQAVEGVTGSGDTWFSLRSVYEAQLGEVETTSNSQIILSVLALGIGALLALLVQYLMRCFGILS